MADTDIRELSKPLAGCAGYRFGLDHEELAKLLRALGDSIASGGCIPQEASLKAEASTDDFTFHTLTIKYAAQKKVVEPS